MFFHSWIVFPLLLAALSLGGGMLLRRIAGPALPGVLILPAGFALVVTVSVLLTWASATAPLAASAIAVVAVIGLVLGAGRLRNARGRWREVRWPALAALLPGGAVAAPVVLTGHAGFTGYSRIVDIAFQFEIGEWMQHHGRSVPSVVDSSYTSLIGKTLNIGYPGGSQAALGASAHAGQLDVAWAYQPFLAWSAAMLGLSLFFLLRRAIPHRGARAIAAGVAAQPSILYGYGLSAGIKELSTATLLVTTVALLHAAPPGRAAVRQLVPTGVAVAAAFATFNLGVVPWLGIAVLVLLLADLATAGKEIVARGARWVALGVGTIALAAPTVAAAVKLAPVVSSGGPGDLGNLANPVPAWSALGVWMTSDYRFPIETGGHPSLNTAGLVLVAALIVLGVVWTAARRDWGLFAMAASGAIALAYVVHKSGPWVELKAFAVTAPLALALAFAGAGAVGRIRPWLGLGAGGVVAAAVLFGNALIYHGNNLAPAKRFAELQQIGERWAGKGPTLQPSFEEYAEYFLRDARSTTLVNPPNFDLKLRPGLPDAFVRDIDDFEPAFVQKFPLLVLRRDPTGSRPPSDYRLVQRTDYYDVWRRTGDGATIRRHLPLDRDPHHPAKTCRSLVRSVESAGPGARIAYATYPEVVVASPRSASFGWAPAGQDFIARTPGRFEGAVDLPSGGTFALWMRGSVGRRIQVYVDGKPAGSLRWKESYPGQYEPLTTMRLTAGQHRVSVVRGGGGLLPGTGNDIGTAITTSLIGPITFAPVNADAVVQVAPASRAAALCSSRRQLDWVEVVGPATA